MRRCKFIKAAPTERADPQSSIEAGPDGHFIKASPQWPLYQGLWQVSRPAPTRRADGLRRPNPLLRRASSLSTAGRSLQLRPAPMASLSRPAPNGRFIKGFSQFMKATSNQKGRPLDLVLGGTIRYCAAQAVYQRPAGHGLQSRPGRPLDLVLGGSICYCAAQAVYQRPAGHGLQLRPAPIASLSRPAPNGHFIKGFSQFVKASSNQKGRPPRSGLRRPNPLLRRTSSLSTAGRPTALMEAQPFYESLMAALSSYPNGGH